MNTIAHLSGNPLAEDTNHGQGSSLLVTANPSNANNDREVKYVDPSNMVLGTNDNAVKISSSDTKIGKVASNYNNSITVDPSSNRIDIVANEHLSLQAGTSNLESSTLTQISCSDGEISISVPYTGESQVYVGGRRVYFNCPVIINNNITINGNVTCQTLDTLSNLDSNNSDPYPIGSFLIGFWGQSMGNRSNVYPGQIKTVDKNSISDHLWILTTDGTGTTYYGQDISIKCHGFQYRVLSASYRGDSSGDTTYCSPAIFLRIA